MDKADKGASDEWRDAADAVIRALALSGKPFTAEDVRDFVGDPPRSNAIGARFMSALRSGMIVRDGWKHAERKEAHARALAVYTGKPE
jgi:hypothetical protein